MKGKSRVQVALLLCSLLLFAGCGPKKALNPDDFSKLFISATIYGERIDEFEEVYQDVDSFYRLNEQEKANLKQDLMAPYAGSTEQLDEAVVEKLYETLLASVSEKTRATVENIEQYDDGSIMVTYAAYGLDAVALSKIMVADLTQKMQDNPALVNQQDLQMKANVEALMTALPQTPVKGEPTEFSLYFKISDGKWYLPVDQGKSLDTMYYAFYFGATGEGDLQRQVQEGMAK